jgi:hypothetical protein
LQHHGSPQHLHVTSRRTFIGPIPKGWTGKQRKRDIYGDKITRSYQKRSATFSAATSPAISRSNTQFFEQTADNLHARESGSTQHLEQATSESALIPPADFAPPPKRKSIRFDLADQGAKAALVLRTQMTQSEIGTKVKNAFRSSFTDGEILRMEKMLVRVDDTKEKVTDIPKDYDENTSQTVDTQTTERFREYVVVCRKTDKVENAKFVLQIYKTRVIPALEQGNASSKPKFEIPLDMKRSNLNMYSSLDKSLAFWVPQHPGFRIFILQCRAPSSSVEWLTFIRGLLGHPRPNHLLVRVPEMSVNLRLNDPFESLKLESQNSSQNAEEALAQSIAKEEIVAQSVIDRSMEMLAQDTEIDKMVQKWRAGQPVGLVWKRYDRLEWVHGVNERKMFAMLAMIQSHDLELRPKEHYPTTTITRKGKTLEEPPPIEGFLVRLTSQTGRHKRLGLVHSTRLYFASFDRYLVFTRPSKAVPPKTSKIPSRTRDSSANPTSGTASSQVFNINPYPLHDGEIEWLDNPGPRGVKSHDDDAFDEARRKLDIIDNCEGFIDLASVIKVRKLKEVIDPTEIVVDNDSSDDDDSNEDDTPLEKRSCFEMILANGLIVRFKAYDQATKREWKKSLRALCKYWRWRHKQDIQTQIETRERNLRELQVDEAGEAWAGQFGRKWELSNTYASPHLFNICSIACCRDVHQSGPLYLKPRLHGTFTLHHCILIPGALLLFQENVRSTSGKIIPHIHHNRVQRIDLKDAYMYTGLLTENDLLYRYQHVNPEAPGQHALPRIWTTDGWDSFDEDVMSCFALWRPGGKSWFRAPGTTSKKKEGISGEERKRARLMRVSALGKKGNRMVFRARSRAERDLWVVSLATEIERVNAKEGGEEIRLIGSGI